MIHVSLILPTLLTGLRRFIDFCIIIIILLFLFSIPSDDVVALDICSPGTINFGSGNVYTLPLAVIIGLVAFFYFLPFIQPNVWNISCVTKTIFAHCSKIKLTVT